MENNQTLINIQKSLEEGERFLDFLSEEIQRSAQMKISLFSLFDNALKEEQKRYSKFQSQYAIWMKESFNLRRQLLSANNYDLEKKRDFVELIESQAKAVENLFDSWEDTVEGHRTSRTDTVKVTIPMIAVIISLLSLIIALLK